MTGITNVSSVPETAPDEQQLGHVSALHQALCALNWLLNARTGMASRAMLVV